MKKYIILSVLFLTVLSLDTYGQVCDSIRAYVTPQVKKSKADHSNLMTLSDKKNYPQFPGGRKNLKKYIKDSLIISEEGNKESMIILVCFRINCTGQVREIELLGDPKEYGFSNIGQILFKMPLWIPAKENGKNVDAWYFYGSGSQKEKKEKFQLRINILI
jgi:hypothetical protein